MRQPPTTAVSSGAREWFGRLTARQVLGAVAVIVGVLVCGQQSAVGSPIPLLLLIAVGVALIPYQWPHLGIPLIFLGILTDEMGGTGLKVASIPVTASKLTVALVLFTWGVHVTVNRKPLFYWTPITSGLIAVLCSMLVAVGVGSFQREGVKDLITVGLLTLLVHLVYATAAKGRQLWLVLRILAMITLVVVFASVWMGRAESRSAGSFGNPNAFAAVLILTCHMALGVLVTWRHRLRPYLISALMACYVLALYQTGSRAGIIVAMALSPAMVWASWRDRRMLFLTMGALIIALPFAVSDADLVWGRFERMWAPTIGDKRDSIDGRVLVAQSAWWTFLENPFTGSGAGTLSSANRVWYPGRSGKDTHNSYLQILGEQGMIGALSHLYLALLIARTLWRSIVHAMTPDLRIMSAYLSLGLMGYALMMVTSGKLTVYAVGYFTVAIALIVARPPGRDMAKR